MIWAIVCVGLAILAIPINAWGDLTGGISCIGTGIIKLYTIPMEGMTMLGVGFIRLTYSVLKTLLFVYIVAKWIPKLVRFCVKKIKDLSKQQRGGNEI